MPNQDSDRYWSLSTMPIMTANNGLKNFYAGSWYTPFQRYLINLLTVTKIFILSIVGTATALGQPVEIPIILRTLASSIALVNEDALPLNLNPDSLAALDTPAHDKSKVVQNHNLKWWSGRKPRDLNTVDILKSSTLRHCLENYRQQSKGAGSTPDSFANASTPADTGRTDTGKANTGPGCPDCKRYRQVISDLLQDVLKFQNFASVMSTSSKALLHIGLRKASTYNLLHEAAILKETAEISPPERASKIHHISAVSGTALSELNRLKERLKNLPESSYKWTWGETLSNDDVLNLRRTGTKPGPGPHSGYDISLPEGKQVGVDSVAPSTSFSGPSSNIPADASSHPPSTDLSLPIYFSNPDPRSYDPFNLSFPKLNISNTPPPTMTVAENTTLALADNWSAGTNSGPGSICGETPGQVQVKSATALALAEHWSSSTGSDHSDNIHRQVSAGEPLALALADNWSAGSESDHAGKTTIPPASVQASHAPATSIFRLAENWSESAGSVSDHAGKNTTPPVSVPSPPTTSVFRLANHWSDSNGDDPSLQADSGLVQVSPPASTPVSPPASIPASIPASPQLSVFRLAGDWSDSNRDSDDEASLHRSLPAQPSALRMAEHWMDSDEDSGNEELPALGGWSYGPEHFEFLQDDMFESDVDES